MATTIILKRTFQNLRSRRLRIVRAEKCDVLILQDIGKEFLMACIPEPATAKIFSLDRELPIILSLSYFIRIVSSIVAGVRPGAAVLRAAIKLFDPLVVLSGDTTANLSGEVAEIFPNKSFIVLSSCVLVPPLLPQKLPIFCSYGNYDKDVLDQVGAVYAEHHPIGSIKAGLIKRNFGNKDKQFDICFISQYRDSIADRNLAAAPQGLEGFYNDIFDAYNAAIAIAYEYTCRFSKKNNMRLCVAMSASHTDPDRQEKEKKYFRSFLSNGYDPVFIPRTSQSSYEAVMSSRVSLTIDSALGYEALGMGEKVLFFVQIPCMRQYYQKQFKSENPKLYSNLPQELKIIREDFKEFEDKLTRLLSLTGSEYLNLIKDAKTYYMNNSETSPPDEYLKRTIRSLLKKDHTGRG